MTICYTQSNLKNAIRKVNEKYNGPYEESFMETLMLHEVLQTMQRLFAHLFIEQNSKCNDVFKDPDIQLLLQANSDVNTNGYFNYIDLVE